MEVCCTLGMIEKQQALELKEAGLTAYNHNLDTSREYYPNIITTRSYDERLETLQHVREAGISVCSGNSGLLMTIYILIYSIDLKSVLHVCIICTATTYANTNYNHELDANHVSMDTSTSMILDLHCNNSYLVYVVAPRNLL